MRFISSSLVANSNCVRCYSGADADADDHHQQPTLSVGKVGGLTVDLLAATYGLPRVGWLEDENVLPVASNDTLTLLPRPDGALSTNLEGARARMSYERRMSALTAAGCSVPRRGEQSDLRPAARPCDPSASRASSRVRQQPHDHSSCVWPRSASSSEPKRGVCTEPVPVDQGGQGTRKSLLHQEWRDSSV
jgi:hypothetical protein